MLHLRIFNVANNFQNLQYLTIFIQNEVVCVCVGGGGAHTQKQQNLQQH